jgi:hypothetical protein
LIVVFTLRPEVLVVVVMVVSLKYVAFFRERLTTKAAIVPLVGRPACSPKFNDFRLRARRD